MQVPIVMNRVIECLSDKQGSRVIKKIRKTQLRMTRCCTAMKINKLPKNLESKQFVIYRMTLAARIGRFSESHRPTKRRSKELLAPVTLDGVEKMKSMTLKMKSMTWWLQYNPL